MAGPVTNVQPTDQKMGARISARLALIIGGVALVILAAAIVAVRLANSPSGQQLASYQLRSGDCLTGSNLGLGTRKPWPDLVTAVPCTQQHLAEVFFAGNAWPQSLTYPGDREIADQSDLRCRLAFSAYDGISIWESSFTFDTIGPARSSDWAAGDRLLACVAYKGTRVNYSIKGSRQ